MYLKQQNGKKFWDREVIVWLILLRMLLIYWVCGLYIRQESLNMY